MTRFLRWLARRDIAAAYDAGYRAAVDKILLLPEKVRLGSTLETDGDVSDCTFVGGAPAVRMGPGTRIEHCFMEECELGIRIDAPDHSDDHYTWPRGRDVADEMRHSQAEIQRTLKR